MSDPRLPDVLVVDARMLWGSGIGRHVREVTQRLIARREFRETVLAGDPAELNQWIDTLGNPANVRVLPLAGLRYSARSQWGWARLASKIPPSAVVWFPHWDAPLLFDAAPSVVTLHDLIPLRVAGSANPMSRALMRVWLRRACRRAKTVVTVSRFTRTDLLAFDPSLADHTQVVPGGGAADVFFRPAKEPLPSGVRRPYLLAVAIRKPHKNLAACVEVLARLSSSVPALQLVVAGKRFPEWTSVMELARSRGVAERVVDLPVLDDARLAALYQQSECLLMPSYYEGFGLPLLEAMACGTPVVASNTSAIPEIAGVAALFADPDDYTSLAAAVTRVRTDMVTREGLIARGRERSAHYTWDATAAAMADILRAAAQ